jgi:hypothetical protein
MSIELRPPIPMYSTPDKISHSKIIGTQSSNNMLDSKRNAGTLHLAHALTISHVYIASCISTSMLFSHRASAPTRSLLRQAAGRSVPFSMIKWKFKTGVLVMELLVCPSCGVDSCQWRHATASQSSGYLKAGQSIVPRSPRGSRVSSFRFFLVTSLRKWSGGSVISILFVRDVFK